MNRWNAFLRCKCPKCHGSEMFVEKNILKLNKIHQMPPECSICGQSFEPEPGFYYGAMYVSYGFTTAMFIASYIVLHFILKVETWQFFTIYGFELLFTFPFLFRYSRVLWIYLFYSYDKNAASK